MRLTICLSSVALVAASVALAEVDQVALDILRQTIVAEGTVNFSGMRTMVMFENGVKLRGFEQTVYEKAPGKLRMMVVAPPEERGRLCVSDGLVHWEYDPMRQQAVRRELPPPEERRQRRLADLEKVTRGMNIHYLGTDTVAGRRAHMICVCTGAGTPVKKTWVDTETFVVLRTQNFDSQGQIKLSWYYTAINYQPVYTPGMFEFTPPEGCTVREVSDAPQRMPLAEAERRAGYRAVLPGYLPPGYKFQADAVGVIPMRGRMVLWLNFSNGADTFSIFQRPRVVNFRPRQMGRMLDWCAGEFAFTLVGGLSKAEMIRVRASVQP